MSTETGSYLVTEMTQKIMDSLRNHDNDMKQEQESVFLGEMIEEIQVILHEGGKQQITFSFNNHTRYLIFKRNPTYGISNEVDKQEDENREGDSILEIDDNKQETNGTKARVDENENIYNTSIHTI